MVFNRLLRSLFLGRGNPGAPIVNVIKMEGDCVLALVPSKCLFCKGIGLVEGMCSVIQAFMLPDIPAWIDVAISFSRRGALDVIMM